MMIVNGYPQHVWLKIDYDVCKAKGCSSDGVEWVKGASSPIKEKVPTNHIEDEFQFRWDPPALEEHDIKQQTSAKREEIIKSLEKIGKSSAQLLRLHSIASVDML